jgi:hypothetical protein
MEIIFLFYVVPIILTFAALPYLSEWIGPDLRKRMVGVGVWFVI